MERSILETTWETLAKAGGAIATIVVSYAAVVHAWYNSRFKTVHKRIDGLKDVAANQGDTLDKHDKILHKHDNKFATLEVHVENGSTERQEIKEGIKDLSGKLDRLIERSG